MALWNRIFRRKGNPDPPAPRPRVPRQQWGEDYDYDVDNYERKGMVPMRWQTLLYSLFIAGAVSLFTNPSMWAHIDRIKHQHATLLKGGLIGIIDMTLLVLTLWAFNGRTFAHRTFSGIGAAILTIAMLVHAGAINELEATHTENVETVGLIRDGLKDLAQGESEGAARAQSDAAIKANARGQRKLAAQLGRQADSKGQVSEGLADKYIQEVKGVKDKTFLPNWYMDGAMYWALMVLAFTLGVISATIAERGKAKQRQAAQMPPAAYYEPQYPPPQYTPPPQTPSTRHMHNQPDNGGRPGKV
jgi:hypothetical protein